MADDADLAKLNATAEPGDQRRTEQGIGATGGSTEWQPVGAPIRRIARGQAELAGYSPPQGAAQVRSGGSPDRQRCQYVNA